MRATLGSQLQTLPNLLNNAGVYNAGDGSKVGDGACQEAQFPNFFT